MWVVIGAGILFYLFYTWRYAIRFARLDTHFTNKQKRFHAILIWLIPFGWIGILKIFLKPKEYIFPKKYEEKGITIDNDNIHLP